VLDSSACAEGVPVGILGTVSPLLSLAVLPVDLHSNCTPCAADAPGSNAARVNRALTIAVAVCSPAYHMRPCYQFACDASRRHALTLCI
jgi:hypothetical protein